jgi:hypothetical protein
VNLQALLKRLSTRVAATAGPSTANICKHIDDCLQRTNKDADQIKEGVRTRKGKMVGAGAEACPTNVRVRLESEN